MSEKPHKSISERIVEGTKDKRPSLRAIQEEVARLSDRFVDVSEEVAQFNERLAKEVAWLGEGLANVRGELSRYLEDEDKDKP